MMTNEVEKGIQDGFASAFQDSDPQLILAHYEARFTHGDQEAIFDALTYCFAKGAPVPRWIQTEIRAGWDDYKSGKEKYLGKALGIERPKGWRKEAHQKSLSLSTELYILVQQARKNGETVEDALNTAAAAKAISFAKARQYYYQDKNLFDELRKYAETRPDFSKNIDK